MGRVQHSRYQDAFDIVDGDDDSNLCANGSHHDDTLLDLKLHLHLDCTWTCHNGVIGCCGDDDGGDALVHR